MAWSGVVLCSAPLSIGTAHGALNSSVDVVPGTGRGIPAGDRLDKSVFASLRHSAGTANSANTANTATQPAPAPTEYMLLAGVLLILWGILRWKHRARRSVYTPRSRPKR